MAGIIGKKIGMTSVYSAEGKNLPCTIIEAGTMCRDSNKNARKGWI
jgi:ribosomal protein L3